jgi:hypothetical protein
VRPDRRARRVRDDPEPALPAATAHRSISTAEECIVRSLAWDGDASTSASGAVVSNALTDAITLACYATK